jgi:hypothetical protein
MVTGCPTLFVYGTVSGNQCPPIWWWGPFRSDAMSYTTSATDHRWKPYHLWFFFRWSILGTYLSPMKTRMNFWRFARLMTIIVIPITTILLSKKLYPRGRNLSQRHYFLEKVQLTPHWYRDTTSCSSFKWILVLSGLPNAKISSPDDAFTPSWKSIPDNRFTSSRRNRKVIIRLVFFVL